MSIRRTPRRVAQWIGFIAIAVGLVPAVAPAEDLLPPGGETAWEIRNVEEIVTFALFDPATPGVVLPKGLGFIRAADTPMPAIQEHLKAHPDHAAWAFSIIEITRQEAFLIDGRGPSDSKDGAIGLWFAPVDPSGIAEIIPADVFTRIIGPAVGSVLGLGIWVPDREYVTYMLEKGHHGEYGQVTLAKDRDGVFHGEIGLDDLHVSVSAKAREGVQEDPEAGTQVLFLPHTEVERVAVIAGALASHRECDAEWSASGEHPLSKAVFIGPTYLTTYGAPLTGSLYRLLE